MAEKLLAITTEYIRSFLALWQTEIGWPQSVLSQLVEVGLDMLDVLHVLKEGDVIECEKETADGAIMVVEGFTCDDVKIQIEVWGDVNAPQIRLRNIKIV